MVSWSELSHGDIVHVYAFYKCMYTLLCVSHKSNNYMILYVHVNVLLVRVYPRVMKINLSVGSKLSEHYCNINTA